jgi:hypothetical protein
MAAKNVLIGNRNNSHGFVFFLPHGDSSGRIPRMTRPNLQHQPHEQRKIEQLLARLAKMQTTWSKPAPIAFGASVIKTA